MIINITKVNWKAFPVEIVLEKNAVYVFKVDAPTYFKQIGDVFTEVLSENELIRADRFIQDVDRQRFISGRYLVRTILSKIKNTDPAQIEFKYSANKKPLVDGVEFNVSHSSNNVLLAVSKHAVGIDIELINHNFAFDELLATNFNADEAGFIKNGNDYAANFYTLWTRKEAILKASGEGLTDQLDNVPCLNEKIERNGITYNLTSFNIDENYIACLATAAMKDQITYVYYK